MKPIVAIVLAAAGLVIASTAHAATPCPATDGDGRAVSLEGRDREFVTGLSVSVLLGLTPHTFPYDDVASQGDACTRGEFDVGGETYRAFGGDEDTPPRWAVGQDPRRIAYLAVVPPPAAALRWARSRNRNQGLSFTEPPLYALAITNGDTRDIFSFSRRSPATRG